MSREVKYSDPNMTHEGVLAYREQFDLCPNKGFRRDIAVTIVTYDDLCIWTNLLAAWGYIDRKTGKWKARNPLDIKGLLTCFEFKKREKENAKLERDSGHNQASLVSTRGRKRLRARSDGELPKVSVEPPSQYFRVG